MLNFKKILGKGFNISIDNPAQKSKLLQINLGRSNYQSKQKVELLQFLGVFQMLWRYSVSDAFDFEKYKSAKAKIGNILGQSDTEEGITEAIERYKEVKINC